MMLKHADLTEVIIECFYDVYKTLGYGFLEKVYENGLLHRLRRQGVTVTAQHPLKVMDVDGTILGEYFADLFVDSRLVVELKACRALADEHVAQLLDYLRASRVEHGMLINFGSSRLEIRKYVLTDS